MIKSFCDIPKSDTGHFDYNEAREARVLISTMSLMGQGFNITRARRCILVDLDYTLKAHKQAFGRVHRTGQKHNTKLLLFHTPGNPVENNIMERQDSRREIGDLTWKVTTGENQLAAEKAARRAAKEQELRTQEDMV
jgi:hypothetical protein